MPKSVLPLIAFASWTLTVVAAPMDEAAPKPLMRDFMGINAHTFQFDPKLYAPLCRLVRDYHPFGWDVNGDTATPVAYPHARMPINWEDKSGRWKSFNGRVDWKQLYSSWQTHGWEIDACIQFDGFKPERWKDPARDAYLYGKTFAEYFGPSGPHKLVTSIEIGNEPEGDKRYSDEQYMTIFRNMAQGVRDGDPKLTILTCTASANAEGDAWAKAVDLFRDTPELYDVINVHKYARIKGWPTFERTFPEDAQLNYLQIVQNTIDWRDRHAPDKRVWITEFGYDSSTQTPAPTGNMAKWKGVTDTQQAQWIVRSFLCFAAMDLDRAYLYWFNDGDWPSVHASSGVTRYYQPKPSYFAMRHLYQSLGDYRFQRVVQRGDGQPHVFEFVKGSDAGDVVWAVWSATGDDRTVEVPLTLPGRAVKAQRMPMKDGPAAAVRLAPGATSVKLSVGESPIYIWIRR